VAVTHYLTRVLAESLPGDRKQLVGIWPRTPLELGNQLDGYCPPAEAAIDAAVLTVIEMVDRLPIPSVSWEMQQK
jgi:hypothetical protein